MKKSIRLFIKGSMQPIFYNRFIKDNADKLGVKGFVRRREDGRMEIFLEGDIDSVNQMTPLCKRGPTHSMVKEVKEQTERFQDFKDFRILNF